MSATDAPLLDKAPLAADWLVGGGEMGALIRAHDWSKTPLGPIEQWPQSLRSAVSILLPSKAQIVLFWGPELVAIYNNAYGPVFGAKHPWALGKPARECWREVWSVLDPLFGNVLAHGEAFWAKDYLFGLARHGYVEETYFDVSYDPVRDESGRVGGLFCIVSETTGRIIGERRLAALRDLGRIAPQAASVRDVYLDAGAAIARYDKDIPFAALYAWNATERRGSLQTAAGFGELRPPDDIEAGVDAAWPIGREDDCLLAEPAANAPMPPGPWPEAPRQIAVLKIATPGKEPYGYLVAGINARRRIDEDYRDFLRLVSANIASAIAGVQALEEERRRNATLAELDRAKTAFFSNVSHEFRTPLTLMLGPLDDLLANTQDEERRRTLAMVQRNAQRLLKLVNTLLDFARIEAGRALVRYEATDLSALTADLASNFRSACERAGIALQVECAPLGELAYVDREMWEKIVLNLLSNAFKFTFSGGINVRLSATEREFQLRVRDTGGGIPSESLPKIFDRFHRIDGARGRSFEGSGIGLALVSELVKLHGGAISVESVLDEGSTFTVTVPKGRAHLPNDRVVAQTTTAEARATSRAESYVAEALGWLPVEKAAVPAPIESGTRILLADDNADLREYARRLLAEHYDVEVVSDGLTALEAIRQRRPDLIVADVMMPRLDGFELLQAVRADATLRTIPTILLSARAGEEARVEGLDRGADDYIVKPFSSREFLVRIAALLKSAELQRRTQQALSQFETLLNNAPLGVYLVDDEFRIAAVNPVARPMFGPIPDLIGRDFDEVIRTLWPAAYADEVIARFRRTLTTGEPYVVPERVERRLDRGVSEYYEWQINRIPLPRNRFGVVCYFRDISYFVLAREALREADNRKDEFLATLAHELRNPLAPLRSSLEALRIGGVAGKFSGSALDIMERQVNHLVRLVDDLLEVSRITRGTVELRKETMRLDASIHNALETSEPLIRAGDHRVVVSVPTEPILIDADPVRLAQVFGNLINNAAKYSERGGTIRIDVSRDANEAVVAVADTGDGIDADQLQQLFKLFSRGRGSAKRHQSGLGIGLALVRRLVEMHGGRVDARSEGLGKGSCFTVRLPLSSAPRIAPTQDSRPASHAAARTKILVVDDNRDAAESLCMLLTQLGADVTATHGGAEALRAFDAHRPRVVLLDIGMPTMDGYEVARRLRAAGHCPRPILIAVTGWSQERDRQRARDAGFDHHLVKPIEVATLQSLLAELQDAREESHALIWRGDKSATSDQPHLS